MFLFDAELDDPIHKEIRKLSDVSGDINIEETSQVPIELKNQFY